MQQIILPYPAIFLQVEPGKATELHSESLSKELNPIQPNYKTKDSLDLSVIFLHIYVSFPRVGNFYKLAYDIGNILPIKFFCLTISETILLMMSSPCLNDLIIVPTHAHIFIYYPSVDESMEFAYTTKLCLLVL